MHITIIGSGYVGLVAGACFAQMGNNVTCLDVDSKKIESLKQGIIPIYEPGLESMVLENTARGTLSFTTNKAQAICGAEVIFIAVGTPMGDDGSADLRFVRAVAEDIGAYMAREYVVVVDKSTVPVGTAREVRSIIESSLAKRGILAHNGDERLESTQDSERTSAVGHCPTTIKSHSGDKRSVSPTLKASSGWGIVKGEGATSQFKPLPLNKKENTESKEVNQILEAKGGYSERLDSESEIQTESAKVGDSEKQDSDSKKLESAIDLESQKGKSGDTQSVDCHDFASAKSRNDKDLESAESKTADFEKTNCHEATTSRNDGNHANKPACNDKRLESSNQTQPPKPTQTQAFDVVSNPEFLKEGVAIKDFMSPDRVVIGADSKRALEVMKALYAPFLLKSDRLIAMGIESAEMTKYAANAMLATKISFINEMSQICERVGANINDVRQGIGSDSRIGYSFIYPGCGYGGSCFPKDVRALEKTAKDFGYTAQILSAVQAVNEAQKMLLVEKIVKHFGENLKGLCFGVWGLSFKPETDDMREASSLVLIRELIARGARIQAYDPKAYHQAEFYLQAQLDSISFERSKYDALKNAAALVLLTEWREFRSPDFGEMKKLLKTPLIFDGRNIYQHAELESKGFTYYQIGVGKR